MAKSVQGKRPMSPSLRAGEAHVGQGEAIAGVPYGWQF